MAAGEKPEEESFFPECREGGTVVLTEWFEVKTVTPECSEGKTFF